MKQLFLVSIVFWLYGAFSVLAEGQRYALVIGNGTYETLPDLKNPVSDAIAIADQLSSLGFTTFLAQDLSRQEIIRAFEIFEDKATFADTVLFYFAGHAASLGSENFLFSSQFDPDTQIGINESLPLKQIVEQLLPQAQNRLVFLDACQEEVEVITEHGKFQAKSIAPYFPPLNTLIATASAPGMSAHDGFGGHSLFTGALLDNLPATNLDVELMLRKTSRDTLVNSQGIQRPQTVSNLDHRFFFNKNSDVPLQVLPRDLDQPLTQFGYSQKPILNEIAMGIEAPVGHLRQTSEVSELIARLCNELSSNKPKICS